MRPADHPDFFRMPAPEGRSRESTLRIDARGRFWHEGALVQHAGLAAALPTWISRHPDDGRYILTNGYDWTYVTVDDAPFVVQSLRVLPDRIVLRLSDGAEEPWDPEETRIGADAALYAVVKRGAPGGPYEAKFSPHAQTSLGPWLVELEAAGRAGVRVGDRVAVIGRKAAPGRFG